MRSFLLSIASIVAALSLFSVGALAATTSNTTSEESDTGATATACQIIGAPAMPNSTVTGTVTPIGTTTGTLTPTATAVPSVTVTPVAATSDDDVSDEAGQAIRSCIAALHEDGDHAIGQTVSELAHELNAERRDDHEAEKDRDTEVVASPVVVATSSPTSTTATATPVVVASGSPTSTTTVIASVSTTQAKHATPVAEHGHSHGGESSHDGQHSGD